MSLYIIKSQDVLNNALSDIKSRPVGSFTIEVKTYAKKRTNPQNAYYWAVLEIIRKELGYTKEEMHNEFRQHFLGTNDNVSKISGKWYQTIKSTTDLNTKDFADYMTKVQAFAMGQGIKIPTPEYYGY